MKKVDFFFENIENATFSRLWSDVNCSNFASETELGWG